MGEGRAEIEGILARLRGVEPVGVEHVMTAAALRHDARETVGVGVREPQRKVPARAKRPHRHTRRVDGGLLVDPREHGVPHGVGGRGMARRGRVVAGAGNLHDECGHAERAPRFDPHRQVGAVAVEAGDDDDERGRARGCGGGG